MSLSNSNFVLLGLALVLSLLVLETSAQTKDCTMTLEDVDKCGAKLIPFTDKGLSVPTNEVEMNAHCAEMDEALKCFRKYQKNCMTSYPRTVFNIFAHDVRKQVKKRCSSSKGRQDFIKHVGCLKKAESFAPVFKCMDNYVAQIEWMLKNVKNVDQISASCCTFHSYQECNRAAVSDICDSITGKDTMPYIDQMVTAVVSEAIDFSCGPYKNVADCKNKFKPEIMGPLLQVNSDTNKPVYLSPMAPMITMFTNVD